MIQETSTEFRRQTTSPSFQASPPTVASIAAAHWKAILLAVAAGALVSLGVAWLLPNTYTATAVIIPPQQNQSAAAAFAGQLGSLMALGGKDLGFRTPSDLYLGLLGSRSIADALIHRFDLKKVYDAATLEDTRKKLSRKTDLTSGKDSLIKIAVEDTDANRAAALSNAYVEELYAQNKRLALTESAQRRQFFEREVEQEKDILARAEAEMAATQKQTGMLQLSGQVEAVIRSVAQVRAAIASDEVMLRRLETGATEQNSEVRTVQAELAALRAQLAKLQSGSPVPGDTAIPTAAVPDAGLSYMRRLRELKYHESLYEIFSKQYEAAKVDEAKEASVIQVVDHAAPPDKKSGPPRFLLTVAGALCSGVLALSVFAARATFLLRV